MRFLQALFPDSYFVALLRHPIPVTLATQPWGGDRDRTRLVEHWFRAHRLFVEDLPHLRRVHVVRYEDLVADPDAVLGRAFAFLGLEDAAAGRTKAEGVNVDNFEADRTLRTGVNDRYFAEWRAPEARARSAALYYTAIERRYERQARHFGYSLVRAGDAARADARTARAHGRPRPSPHASRRNVGVARRLHLAAARRRRQLRSTPGMRRRSSRPSAPIATSPTG